MMKDLRSLIIPLVASFVFLLMPGCAAKPTLPSSSLDLVPFQVMASTAECADSVNRLFLIDDQMVFWQISGFCADAAYSFMLFGSNPDELLCRFNDSIAGPMKECFVASYQGLFDTILEHSEEADLGLGSQHTIQPVPF